MARPFRIVAFDGGGVRGIYTLTLLKRLDDACPRFLGKADLLAGTSTGAIIAVGLAAGFSLEKLIAWYADRARAIFADTWLDNVRDLGRAMGAQYSQRPLKALLEETFGDMRLAGLPRRVLVPTFRLDGRQPRGPGVRREVRAWKPKFFHNFPGPDSDGPERVVDVLLRSCAAPTYFPTYQGYVDGGVVANNPSMAALAQALDERNRPVARRCVRARLEDLRLLSLGTGGTAQFIAGERHDWGYVQWARPLLSMLFDGMIGVADFQCARLLGPRYHRLAPWLPEPIALDDARQTRRLVRLARRVPLAATVRWLKKWF